MGTETGGDGKGAWTGGIGCIRCIGAGLGKEWTTFVPGDSDGGSRWTEFSTQPVSRMTATKKIPDFNTPLFC